MKQLQTIGQPVAEPSETDVTAAETAMWGWYLEWSTIARHAIHDRNLLRALGFLRPTRGASDAEDESEEDEPIDEAETGALNGAPLVENASA